METKVSDVCVWLWVVVWVHKLGAGRLTRGRTRFDTFAKHITTSIIVTIIGFVTCRTGIIQI